MTRFGRRLAKGIGLVAGGLLTLAVLLAAVSWVNNLRLPTEPPADDRLDALDVARLAETIHLRDRLGNRVWPGWGEAPIPLVVYNQSHAFLVGAEDPPPGWVTVPGGAQRGGPWEPVADERLPAAMYYRSPLPPGVTPQAFTVRIGDAWAASLGTKAWLEYELVRTLRDALPGFLRPIFPYELFIGRAIGGSDGHVATMSHESFHAYQGIVAEDRLVAGERAIAAGERAYPWDDEALQAAWQAELDALAEGVRAESDADALAAARDFLSLRDERRASLPAALAAYERQREWTEGLAKYIELSVWRAADAASDYEPVAALAQDRSFHGYGAATDRWTQEIDQLRRMADDHGDGRFYYSGMAQAMLLDRLAAGWKERVLEPGQFLDILLKEAVASESAG